jgi:hypothetical protein
MIPFIGLIVSLTLWGSFAPVPFTNINPHESFVGRLSGAFKAAYVATGTYELVQTVSISTSNYGRDVVAPAVNDSNPIILPTPTRASTQFVYDLRTVELKEPSRTTSDGVGSDSKNTSVTFAQGMIMFVVGSLLLGLLQRLGLVSYTVQTLDELLDKLGNKLSAPPKKPIYYLEVVDPNEVTLDSIVAMVEQSRAPVMSGIASFYPSCDSSMFAYSLAYRPPPQPCQALVLFQHPVVRPTVSENVMTFHHAADEAISSLIRLRGDEDVKDLDFSTPTEDADSSPADNDNASAAIAVSGSDCSPQSKALVLFRLESLSHLMIPLVCALLSN